MFRDEKINLLKIKNTSLKLEDDKGNIVALFFIKDDQLIIKSNFNVSETKIECPKINII
jgi:hypothetical protein